MMSAQWPALSTWVLSSTVALQTNRSGADSPGICTRIAASSGIWPALTGLPPTTRGPISPCAGTASTVLASTTTTTASTTRKFRTSSPPPRPASGSHDPNTTYAATQARTRTHQEIEKQTAQPCRATLFVVPTLLIVHHTASPSMHTLFEAVRSGATDPQITGV